MAGVVADPYRQGNSGSRPLTIGKMRAMNQRGGSSSERPGHEAAYAVDNSNLTWWEPAEDDTLPTLTVDMGSITEFDVPQFFTVDAVRIEFWTGGRFGFGRSGNEREVEPGATIAHRYTIAVSDDGQHFNTILDRTKNDVTRYTEFEELPPTHARFVRLTITDFPRVVPLGVLEFTVFGTSVENAGR